MDVIRMETGVIRMETGVIRMEMGVIQMETGVIPVSKYIPQIVICSLFGFPFKVAYFVFRCATHQ